MIENYEELIDNMTPDEALEIISKMGMNMTDHPYLSEERKAELREEEKSSLISSTTQPDQSEDPS
ncbi:MAG: hypothetical protein HN531_15570 [Opitutae bacterium]|jgi:hypothetical protein|nr:hypothetical protein [Opitutae bacterium]